MVFSALCVIMEGAYVAEKRLRHPNLGAAEFYFQEVSFMKKLVAVLLALVLALSVCACGAAADGGETSRQTGEALKSFTVTVVYEDGSSKDFQYESAEQYVGTVLLEDGLIEGEMGQYGLEIHTVDGIKAVYAEDGAYWAIYEGEEYAMQGIDTTPVVDGGVYKLVYTLA